MQYITITEARKHLSKIVRQVDAGEVFIITKNGQTVLKLEPLNSQDHCNSAKILSD